MRARVLNGYRVVYLPEHPAAMQSENWKGFVYEHIVVAEEFLGRRLTEYEVCHHLDGNRANNQKENILVLLRSQHTKLHSWLDEGAVLSVDAELKLCANPACGKQLPKRKRRFCSIECSGAVYCGQSKCPEKDVLAAELLATSKAAVANKYGVSCRAVSNWVRKFNLNQKQ